MKKSISYWSFSGKNVFEAMRLAKDAGFDGIELTLDAEGDVTMETAPEKLAEIRRAAEESGVEVMYDTRVSDVLAIDGKVYGVRYFNKRQRRWARTQF